MDIICISSTTYSVVYFHYHIALEGTHSLQPPGAVNIKLVYVHFFVCLQTATQADEIPHTQVLKERNHLPTSSNIDAKPIFKIRFFFE